MYYILDENKNPVKVDDVLEWGKMFGEMEKRRVAWDTVNDIDISTVFLGLDHSYDKRTPLLFETMVFGGGGDYDGYQERYSTWDEAEKGHFSVLAMVKAEQPLNNRKILKIKL